MKKGNMKSAMYKVSAVVLAAAAIVGSGFSAVGTYTGISTTVYAAQKQITVGDYTYTDNDDGTITIEKYSGTDTELIIPNELDGKTVSTIGIYAFLNCQSQKITIPDSVTTLKSMAFEKCVNLTSVHIPVNVTEIGHNCFSGCTALKEITVDENNQNYTSDDGIVFSKDKTQLIFYPNGKDDITSYSIPEYVTVIAGSAFDGCDKITEITIPNTFTEIGAAAFFGCRGLKSVNIPDSVTSIGDGAFAYTALESIEFPNSITSLDQNVFLNCNRLTKLVLPKNVTEIPDYAFGGCNQVVDIVIPEGVTTIGKAAFQDCTSLKSVTIPMSLQMVDSSAFLTKSHGFDIYYPGTEEDFQKITVERNNPAFTVKKLKKLEQVSETESVISETVSNAAPENDTSAVASQAESMNHQNNNSTAIIICIAGIAVIGIGVVTFVLIKKKNKKS